MATTNNINKKNLPTKNTTSQPKSKKTNANATAEKKKTPAFATHRELEEEKGKRNEIIRFALGIFFCIFSVYATLAILSYIFTGVHDWQYVNGMDSECGNFMGKFGARVAYYFVQRWFGFASLFMQIFFFALGLRLIFWDEGKNTEKKKKSNNILLKPISKLAAKEEEDEVGREENPVRKIRLWKWFLNCFFLAIWTSILLASIGKIFGAEIIFPGGSMGMAWMQRLDNAFGPVFRYIILIVSAFAYLCYLSTETIHIIRRWVRHRVVNINDKIHTQPTDDEEDDNEEDENENEKLDVNGRQYTIDPDTGEIIYINEEGDEEVNWEFRGGEDGPDHPTQADEKTLIDQHTATTIVFNVEGQNANETQEAAEEAGKQLELFDNDNFGVTTGVEEEMADKEDDDNKEGAGNEADQFPDMIVNVGEVNESAAPNDMGALEPYDPKLDLENYRYPTLDLLKKYDIDTRAIDMEEQNMNKNRIITVLRNFGVEISSIKATVGPTITLYEITPAPGVRIGKIRNLEDDIALSLAALGIRIIAPIPGKGTIGIEVPNAKPQIVSMESVINSKKFQESDMELPMALGKTITNEIFMADLAKMPHLLVAGATGQGKSVGLNAIITSLLYKKHPAELKLVMVDPKKVEFSVYSPLVNHFLAQVEGTEDSEEPIITDVSKVVQTLKSLCLEMDTRYDLLKRARARNVKEYNEKFKSRQLNPNNGHKFMPYIVVIIDEFGDLIMTAGKEIELPIARIAQLARAVGMHMIIATQRPTTNIITGTIKANFPARIAFKVSSMIDSRTILDRPGANQLIGKGDMLFLAGNEPVRVQCAFVDTPEVERINNFVACQQSYLNPFPLPFVEIEGGDGDTPDVDMNHLDPMFEEVARLIVSTQQGSTSMVQRKFSIGYNRAGRLMDQLEVAGIVGPAHGAKPREVLCKSDIDLQNILISMR